jgi:hypothetical protein
MTGCRITPVLVFWTCRDRHLIKFTFYTGFELPSSWNVLPCYGTNLASGNRISTTFNGQNHFKKIAGSKVLDEYYNSYPRK